jgi:hypothetical protein
MTKWCQLPTAHTNGSAYFSFFLSLSKFSKNRKNHNLIASSPVYIVSMGYFTHCGVINDANVIPSKPETTVIMPNMNDILSI